MTTSDQLSSLSERSVVLSLQELAEDLGHTDSAYTPSDSDEAQSLLSALLAASAESGAESAAESDSVPDLMAMPEAQCLAAARRLLAHLAQDPDTAARTQAILSDPPADEHMSVQTAITGAAVLGALIAWLQTKVDIKITRKDGKSEFEFRLTKSPTSTDILRDLAAVVARLLKGPPQ